MSMFTQTIARLNKSGSLSELEEALSKAIQQVRITGKPAELKYTLKIKPQDTEGETVAITDSISVKTGTIPRKPAIFFTTEDGQLSRENPNQAELPLKSIEGGLQPADIAKAQ